MLTWIRPASAATPTAQEIKDQWVFAHTTPGVWIDSSYGHYSDGVAGNLYSGDAPWNSGISYKVHLCCVEHTEYPPGGPPFGEVLSYNVPLANLNCALTLPALDIQGGGAVPDRIAGALTLPALAIQGVLGVPDNLSGGLTLPALNVQGQLSIPANVAGTLTMPALRIDATAKIFLRAALAVSYRIQRAVAFPGWRTYWAMSARDAAATFNSGWALTFSRRIEFGVLYHGPRTLSALDTSWSLRLGADWSAGWSFGSIARQFDTVWGLRCAAGIAVEWACAPRAMGDFSAGWACAPRQRAAMTAAWICAPRLRADFSAIWNCAPRVAAELVLDWGATPPIRVACAAVWSLSAGALRHSWMAGWDYSERAGVRGAFSTRWAVCGQPAAVSAPSWSLSCNGAPLQALRLSVAQTRESGEWRLSATVVAPGDAIEIGDSVAAVVDAISWSLRVVSVTAERDEDADKTIELRAASPISGWSGDAVSRRANISLPHGGLASTVATALAGGAPVAWGLPDWWLTPIMVDGLSDRPAADSLRALALAAGGVLLSAPDGALAARPFSGAHIGSISALEARLARESAGISGVEMRSLSVSDAIEVEGEGNVRSLRVTPLPWRNISLRLAGGGASLTAPPQVATREIVDEILAIVGGIGNAGHPVHRIISARFSDGVSRAVLFRRGEPGIWLYAPMDTVVTLRYETRFVGATVTERA